MILRRLVVGEYQTNCYILGSEETKSAWIIDPGTDGELIIDELTSLGLTARSALLTHTHYDHIAALTRLKEHYPDMEVLLGKEDAKGLDYEVIKATILDRRFFTIHEEALKHLPKPNDYLIDGQYLEDSLLSVIATPGHTPGGRSYYHREGRFIFTGDTLFARAIGRTDLPGGDYPTLIKSCYRILELEDDVRILPGHGPTTTVGDERRKNPYL
ncbi:MAG: MBL fold metallo-hydrolase [Sphaerochaeta sp.]|jgi:glyoxylase-like metal-dependent hydrolase (beta-lactamase superfamily II)|nr:MAG: MBL fold metallo-hydrolase [Sphaerochaeta sp.]